MERLLDTNIVVFMLLGDDDFIDNNAWNIINNAQLNTSAVTVMEIAQLHRIGKIKSKKYKTATDFVQAITKDFGIKILPFAKEHGTTLTKLTVAPNHNDPFDHSIIAHAITENLTLISSDGRFSDYTNTTKQKLKFVFNQR